MRGGPAPGYPYVFKNYFLSGQDFSLAFQHTKAFGSTPARNAAPASKIAPTKRRADWLKRAGYHRRGGSLNECSCGRCPSAFVIISVRGARDGLVALFSLWGLPHKPARPNPPGHSPQPQPVNEAQRGL